MRRRFACALIPLFCAGADAREVPMGRPTQTRVIDPTTLPLLPPPSLADGQMGRVEQVGEVVILEGDDSIVTDDGQGGVGIFPESGNATSLTNRFYSVYGDDFDEVIFLTTFRDTGAQGALAYEISAQSDVDGLCLNKFDSSIAWGAQNHRLHAFVNMEWIDQYPKLDGLTIIDPRSYFYPVLAQEFGHRWLVHFKYMKNGAPSDALLGRQAAHWATNMNADASVFDGVRWVDNGDGTFTAAEENARYSKLDLYAMGLVDASAVAPWFIIDGAVSVKSGNPWNPTVIPSLGARLRGTREDIALPQVLAVCGGRRPAFGASPTAFRVAFALVTRPGEHAGDVVDKAATLDVVRKNWEDAFSKFTGGAGTMCTQVSAPCGSAVARIVGGRIVEAGGNGNGVIEPGEPIDVTFQLRNDGVGDAAAIALTAASDDADFAAAPTAIAAIPNGATVEATVHGKLHADAAVCGRLITVDGAAAMGASTWRGFAQVIPGTRRVRDDAFDASAGFWGVDLDGKDTATVDGFSWGVPESYGYMGFYQFQPDGGNGGGGAAWFTGPERGSVFSGATHSLPIGVSTLWSPWMDLSSAIHPRLRYFAWFIALDVSNPRQAPTTVSDDVLLLEASNDGAAWATVDQVAGEDDRWRQRDVDLETVFADGKIDATKAVLFRFTVNRDAEKELVEAGVDDFQVIGDTAGCVGGGMAPDMGVVEPPVEDGGGCAMGGGRGRHAVALTLTLTLTLTVVRRRRKW